MNSSLKEILILTKAGLTDTYSLNSFRMKGAKGKSYRPLIMVVVLFVALVPSFFQIFWQYAGLLELFGRMDLLISLGVMAVTLFAFITTIYKASGFLFDFKDYDMLTSLPLRNSSIFVSKLLQLFINNFVIAFFISLEIFIVYAMKVSPGVVFYVYAVILMPFLLVVPTIVGSALAYLVSTVSSRLKKTTIANYVGMVFILAAVFAMEYYLQALITDSSIPGYLDALMKYYFIGDFYIKALTESNLASALLFISVNTLILVLFVSMLSKSFKSINAKLTEKSAKSNYRLRSLQTSSVMSALYKREVKTYFGNPIYFLNTAIGMIMYLIYAVAVTFFGSETVSAILDIPEAMTYIAAFSLAIAAFTITIASTTPVSISIEGKTFWLIKSLPVKFKQIMTAKVLLNYTLSVPIFIVSTIILAFGLKLNMFTLACILICGLSVCIFAPLLGLVVNLAFPKLEWKSATIVVKQSASVLINMLANMLIIALLCVLYAVSGIEIEIFALLAALFFAVGTAVVLSILGTWGKKKFEAL